MQFMSQCYEILWLCQWRIDTCAQLNWHVWMNKRKSKQTNLHKSSVLRGCEHIYTLTVELLHAQVVGVEQNLSLACHTLWVWRYPRLLKGQDKIFSPSVPALSVVILPRSFTSITPSSCAFWISFDGNLLFAGYWGGGGGGVVWGLLFFGSKRYILKYHLQRFTGQYFDTCAHCHVWAALNLGYEKQREMINQCTCRGVDWARGRVAGSKGNFLSGGECVPMVVVVGGGGWSLPPFSGLPEASVCMLLCLATAPPHLTVSVSAQVCWMCNRESNCKRKRGCGVPNDICNS